MSMYYLINDNTNKKCFFSRSALVVTLLDDNNKGNTWYSSFQLLETSSNKNIKLINKKYYVYIILKPRVSLDFKHSGNDLQEV